MWLHVGPTASELTMIEAQGSLLEAGRASLNVLHAAVYCVILHCMHC